MYWETNEETEAETGVKENNKNKTIPNPGRWGGVINTWVCAASRFCFLFFLGVQAAGTSLVARFVQQFGRLQGEPDEEMSGWCRTIERVRQHSGGKKSFWTPRAFVVHCAAPRWLVWSQQVQFVVTQPPTSSELEVSARWRLLQSVQTTTRN